VNLTPFIIFDFELSKPLLLVDHLVLDFVLIFNSAIDEAFPLFVLLLDQLCLLGFFLLRKEDSLLDFAFLLLTLLLKHVVLL
jgi:hypothetical protein